MIHIVICSACFGFCLEIIGNKRHFRLVNKCVFEEVTNALRIIREAGNNEYPTAQWMQEWAAYAMEPWKFPRPSLLPPEIG